MNGYELMDESAKWWGPDRHMFLLRDSRADEIYFTTNQPAPEFRVESWSETGDVNDLRAAFADFHADVRAVLDACPAVHKWAIFERDPLPNWTQGNIVLMGDACHPMTPYMAQGAANALEDSVVLSRCLVDGGLDDVSAAFRRFEAARKARTTRCGDVAPQRVHARKNQSRLGIRLRCLERGASGGACLMAEPHDGYAPDPKFLDAFPDVSGNDINGLGETNPRPASPFFWHPPTKQPFGELQDAVLDHHRLSPLVRKTYSPKAPRGPRPVELAPERIYKDPAEWTAEIKKFALDNEADMVGIVPMDPEYVYEGYEINEAWVIMIGVAMDHKRLNTAPDTVDNADSASRSANSTTAPPASAAICRTTFSNRGICQGLCRALCLGTADDPAGHRRGVRGTGQARFHD